MSSLKNNNNKNLHHHPYDDEVILQLFDEDENDEIITTTTTITTKNSKNIEKNTKNTKNTKNVQKNEKINEENFDEDSEEDEEGEENWKSLSSDVILEIFSYLRMDFSVVLHQNTYLHRDLFGYFCDDPNRQLFFLFSNFHLRISMVCAAKITWESLFACALIFRHATQLSFKLENQSISPPTSTSNTSAPAEIQKLVVCQALAHSLVHNWKLQSFENESPLLTSSAAITAAKAIEAIQLVESSSSDSDSSFRCSSGSELGGSLALGSDSLSAPNFDFHFASSTNNWCIQALRQCLPHLRDLSCHTMTDRDLNHLASCSNLESITVRMVLPSTTPAETTSTVVVVNDEGDSETREVKTVEKLFDLQAVLAQSWNRLTYLELNTLGMSNKSQQQHADLRLILGGSLVPLFNQSSIKTLILANQHIQAIDLAQFWLNETMEMLDLSSCTFADCATMQNLAANSHLKNLRLIGCSLNSRLASCLFDTLSSDHLHDRGVLASLEKLSLAVNPQITSRFTKLVSATSNNELVLPKLKQLNMSGCKLWSIGAINVTRLVAKSVKVLYFESCAITDDGFIGILKACPDLMSISLCDNKIQLRETSSQELQLDAETFLCTNMRRVKLQRNDIRSDGAAWLVKLFSRSERLWSFSLDYNTKLGDEGASHLLSIPSLKRLSLNTCGLTDRFILDRFSVPRMNDDVNGTTGDGASQANDENGGDHRHQWWHPNLIGLCLVGNNITDQGAHVLFSSPLSHLLLSGNKQLTEDSVKLLLSSRTLRKIWMEGLPLVSREVKQSIMDHVKKHMADQIISIRL